MSESKLSLLERIAADKAKKEASGDKSLAERAGEVVNEAYEASKDFHLLVDAVKTSSVLCIAYDQRVMGLPFGKATREWHEKPWADQMAALRAISPQNELAQEALDTIEAFGANPLLGGVLQGIMDEVGRPSERVFNASQFDNFITQLIVRGLALESEDRPPRKAFKWGKKYYFPPHTTKAKNAWPFVVRTLGRVREYENILAESMPRVQPLLEKASIGSNPEEQNLHKFVQHETIGSIVIWDAHSRARVEGEDTDVGLLAILLNRSQQDANLVLEGYEADKTLALPGEGYKLPPLISYPRMDGTLEVDFQMRSEKSTERLPEYEYDALMRIQRLVRRWLGQEGRFRTPALSAPPVLETAPSAPISASVETPVVTEAMTEAPKVEEKPRGRGKRKLKPGNGN